METEIRQCPKCGHRGSNDNPYYSEDFACAYLGEQRLAVTWCLHCGLIAEYRQAKIFGLIGTPYMKLSKIYPLQELHQRDYFNSPTSYMGGLFGSHVLRMIWHSINARSKLEARDKHELVDTVRELLQRLPPPYAALTILAVSNTSQSVPLEDQIQQTIYLGTDMEWGFRKRIEDMLRNTATVPNRVPVLEILDKAAR